MIAHDRVRRAAPRSEAGETLVELMVTIVLLGTAIVGILGGIFALVKVSDQNTKVTASSEALQAIVEQLKQPVANVVGNADYIDCGTPAGYTAELANSSQLGLASGTLPTGYSWTINEVDYLNSVNVNGSNQLVWQTAQANTNGVTVNSGCSPSFEWSAGPDAGHDFGVQRIWLEVDSPAGPHQARETVVVTKRDARCPSQNYADQGPC